METIINHVKEYRTQKQYTQDDLAKAVGVTRQTIVALEKGNYIPSLLLAMNICEVLDIPLEHMFKKETL